VDRTTRLARMHRWLSQFGWVTAILLVTTAAQSQTCETAGSIEAAARSSIEAAATLYFEMASKGDSAGLQQHSIPAVAGAFGGIEAAIKESQTTFKGAQAKVRPPFLLDAEGTEPLARAEFLCGVFNQRGQTANSAVFTLTNLPPGKYAVAIVDAQGSPNANTLTLILQQTGAQWKLAGFFSRATQLGGHDVAWFAQKSRDFKAKGQNRNAWLYFREAIFLGVPVDFMSTMATDRLYDESQTVQPSDLPVNGSVVDMNAGTKSYKLTAVYPEAMGNDLAVVARYQAADVSNTVETFKENMIVTRTLVAKYPEFRDAFAGVVSRAVEPSGRDYGSLLMMKDIK
jgi:hypothetical protein